MKPRRRLTFHTRITSNWKIANEGKAGPYLWGVRPTCAFIKRENLLSVSLLSSATSLLPYNTGKLSIQNLQIIANCVSSAKVSILEEKYLLNTCNLLCIILSDNSYITLHYNIYIRKQIVLNFTFPLRYSKSLHYFCTA